MFFVEPNLISHKVFFKALCRSQLPPKSNNLSFSVTNVKSKLTNLCGNRLLQNDLQNTCDKMRALPAPRPAPTCLRFGGSFEFVFGGSLEFRIWGFEFALAGV